MRPGLSITAAIVLSLPATAHGQDEDLLARFASSRASLTSYVGSGTFVANEFSDDPLFTQALSLSPRFTLIWQFAKGNRECLLLTLAPHRQLHRRARRQVADLLREIPGILDWAAIHGRYS